MRIKSLAYNSIVFSAALGISQVLNFIGIVVAARYITPSDYAIYATISIAVVFASLLARFGMVELLIQLESTRQGKIESRFVAITMMSGLLGLTIATASCWVMQILDPDSRLLFPGFAYGLISLLLGLQVVPEGILRSRLNFLLISKVRVLANIIGFFSLLVGLYLHIDLWALILQRLVAEFSITFLLWLNAYRNITFIRSIHKIRDNIGFCMKVVSSSFIDALGNQTDLIMVRIFWGDESLGLYSMAKRLIANLQQLMFMAFRQVSISVVASATTDKMQLAGLFIKGTYLISCCGIAASWAVFYFAEPAIMLLFPSVWIGCVKILEILCWILIYDAFIVMYPSLVQASRRVGYMLTERLLLVGFGLIFLFVAASISDDPVSAAFAVLFQSFITLPYVLYILSKIVGRACFTASYYLVVSIFVSFLVFLSTFISTGLKYDGDILNYSAHVFMSLLVVVFLFFLFSKRMRIL